MAGIRPMLRQQRVEMNKLKNIHDGLIGNKLNVKRNLLVVPKI
jgi:hypothetical protein